MSQIVENALSCSVELKRILQEKS